MKKSRIIVPAMAVIAFSTAASIAGSVAWFTASRTVTISGGTYAVVKTTTNLTAELSAGIGTAVNATDGTKIDFSGKLTDASFNHDLTSGKKFYVPNGAGTAIEKEITLADAEADPTKMVRATIHETSGDVTVYTAATFKITFKMDFGSGSPNVALFLNCGVNKSKFATDGTAYTAKGFRMAFVPTATDSTSGSVGVSKVLAGLQSELDDPAAESPVTQIKYVSGVDNFSGTEYAPGTLMDSTYVGSAGAALPSSPVASATATARKDYLGTFKNNTSLKASITFTVVAWFEGTDPEIKNRDLASQYQAVASTLVFDAIDLA